ncbi:MAG: YhcH/YjgK/YiaL family protein [Sediminibacterium sp.]|jgi:biofilm protein TabA|nr:YhcH/YjgK/YiaL family protein [Chitinophagaceae bacterium]MCA6446215.1 YhcH/YjgK/YiaL family protein [Chitinophagaceae bacterium]
MILAHISSIEQYSSLHPHFPQAIQFLQTANLMDLPTGEIAIAEGVRVIVIEEPLVSESTSLSGFECHNKNIDIQICLRGQERVGWRSRYTCSSPQGAYSDEKDVLFFNDTPDHFFTLTENHFAIYFPNDVHAPMIGEGVIRKIVVKVGV